MLSSDRQHGNQVYKVYNRRFVVLIAVVILNISNGTIWLSYSSVATTAADYYELPTHMINWFSLVFQLISMPFTFLSTFTVNKVGLKIGIYAGATLNCVGAIIKAIGTSNLINDKNLQFTVSLTGQVIAASAEGFLHYIPTKVSQLWFPQSQRTISTTIMALSNLFGVVIAQGITPVIVNGDKNNIPTNNYVWMGVAIFGFLSTFVCVTSEKPKTPPSLSAGISEKERLPYFKQLKDVFTCLPYMLMVWSVGCGVGVVNSMLTLMQQLLCPLGYSDKIAAGANIVFILCGTVGAVVVGIYVDKTKLFTEVLKTSTGLATLFLIFSIQFYIVPHHGVSIIIFSALSGFFGIGAYPSAFELALEATYPVEETISTAFIFLSGEIQGIIAIVAIPALASSQVPSRMYLNVCTNQSDDNMNNYTVPLLVLVIYEVVVVSIMILFMRTPYKRLEVDKQMKQKDANAATDDSTHFNKVTRM